MNFFLWLEWLIRFGALLGDLSVSQEQARSILQNLPPDLGPERRAVVESACKLV